MSKKPNIILIMTDTQGADMVGTYKKGKELHTPNLDKLGENGVVFTRGFTTCPLCTPARAGIFTGMTPSNTGAYTNGLPLGDNVKTMGEIFQKAGYQSAYIGKWHLDGHDYFGTGVCPDGWNPDYWFDGKNYMDTLTGLEKKLWRKGLMGEDALTKNGITEEFCWAHHNSNKAIDFIEKDKEEPYLLVVSYDEPHHPWTCPPEFVKKFDNYEYELGESAFDSLEDKPGHYLDWANSVFGVSEPNKNFKNQMYFASNSYVDYEIGRVIDSAMKQTDQDTIIIYTADHGEMHGAHRMNIKGPTAFDEIANIPFIVSGPNKYVSRGRNSTVVSHLDIIPTIMDYAGIEKTPHLEGGSLINHIKDGFAEDNRSAFLEYTRYETGHDGFGAFQPYRAIVKGKWKLTLHLMDIDELYNSETDPYETKNLINNSDFYEIRDELHKELVDHMDAIRDPFRGSHWVKRSWNSLKRDDWSGPERPKPDNGDGFPFFDYNNGTPMTEVQDRMGDLDNIMKEK